MPKYVIERVVPGASKLSPTELKAMSQRSCSVLNQMGTQIQWVQSFVTDNKLYCIYIAPNEEVIHTMRGSVDFRRTTSLKSKPSLTRLALRIKNHDKEKAPR